jgi:hypothetical protein
MWFVIITCAAGVSCGLDYPIVKGGIQDEATCHQIGNLAISLAHYDRAHFKVTCAKAEEEPK